MSLSTSALDTISAARRQELLEGLGFSEFDSKGEARAFRGILLSEVKRVFEEHQNREHWKNPFMTICSMEDISALVAGIEFYHGAQAEFVNCGYSTVTIKSEGYKG